MCNFYLKSEQKNFTDKQVKGGAIFSVFCFLIPFSAFIADGKFASMGRFGSFNHVRKVAQVYSAFILEDVQHQVRVMFT